MVNYQQGKIYKLWSDESDCFYIGSCTTSLSRRLFNHKGHIKNGKTQTNIDMKNHTNIRIELIEDYPCNSRDELNAREGHHIRLHTENLLNRNIAGRTYEEWRKENKEAISIRIKKYQEANKEAISKWNKEYYEANKDKIKKRSKEYHEANRAAILTRQKEYRESKNTAV